MKVPLIILVVIGMSAWLDKILGADEENDCEDGSDSCTGNQCCVYTSDKYICQDLSKENEECYESYTADFHHTDYFYYCPCIEGLICDSKNSSSLGGDDEVGKCQREKKETTTVLPDEVTTQINNFSQKGGNETRKYPGLTTDKPENRSFKNRVNNFLQQKKKNKTKKYFGLKKSTNGKNLQVGKDEVKNLSLGKPEEKENSQTRNDALEKNPQFFPGDIFEENKCDASSLDKLVSSLFT